MTEKQTPIALEERDQLGARLSSPSAARNRGPIAQALASRLPQGAQVLEVACGTGEHALSIVQMRPDLSWTPSDPDAQSQASATAWAEEAGGRIAPALALDVTQADWGAGLGPFQALYCANMIHIAPWAAAEGLLKGAARVLVPGGALFLYGPFQEGVDTAPSNLDFDVSLKSRDPRWGVRSLSEVDAEAELHGLYREERLEMPANNLLLTYRKVAS